uniref:Uncharacterized protein n=1 Tax=Aegilops tauschii TaxID=37682 RepID=N1QVF6_AEGTA
MSVAELGLGWRSTGELGIGDELLRRQVATAPVLVHGPNKGLRRLYETVQCRHIFILRQVGS